MKVLICVIALTFAAKSALGVLYSADMMLLLIFISSCVGGAAAEVEAEDGVDDQELHSES